VLCSLGMPHCHHQPFSSGFLQRAAPTAPSAGQLQFLSQFRSGASETGGCDESPTSCRNAAPKCASPTVEKLSLPRWLTRSAAQPTARGWLLVRSCVTHNRSAPCNLACASCRRQQATSGYQPLCQLSQDRQRAALPPPPPQRNPTLIIYNAMMCTPPPASLTACYAKPDQTINNGLKQDPSSPAVVLTTTIITPGSTIHLEDIRLPPS
jgi:hypothetical protein